MFRPDNPSRVPAWSASPLIVGDLCAQVVSLNRSGLAGLGAAIVEALLALAAAAGNAFHPAAAVVRSESWRVPPAHRRRRLPVGFIPPCEPTLVDRPPAGQGWRHEIKTCSLIIVVRRQGERIKSGPDAVPTSRIDSHASLNPFAARLPMRR
jgi:hypothetical protein